MLEYNKTTWVDNDLITADALNNIEAGIEASVNAIKTLEEKVSTATNNLRNTLSSKGIEVLDEDSIEELITKVSTSLGNTADQLGVYYLGDEMQSFTGGIEITNKPSFTMGSLSKEADVLKIDLSKTLSSSGAANGSFITTNMVNVAGYKRFCVKFRSFNVDSLGKVTLGVCKTKSLNTSSINFVKSGVIEASTLETTISLDISDVTESGYLGIMGTTGSMANFDKYCNLEIEAMWIEK